MLQRRLSYWLTLCLCRPILEYADAVWNPSARSKTHDVELVQTIAVRFISNLKGHTDSVSEAKNQLQLQSLEDRRAPDCASWRRFSETKISTAHYPQPMMRLQRTDSWRQSPLVQLPEESRSQYAPRKASFMQVSCHELLMRCAEKNR